MYENIFYQSGFVKNGCPPNGFSEKLMLPHTNPPPGSKL